MDLLTFVIEMIGTVAFAVSGALMAIEKKMDILGVCVLGATTAVGGGIIRDLILGNTPPQAFDRPVYIITAVAVSILVFLPGMRRLIRSEQAHFDFALRVMDALGLSIFTVIGIAVAYEGSDNGFLLVFVGVLTGVALAGVAVSTAAFGQFPLVPLLVAASWTVYSSIKKSVRIDGLLSIAAETLILSPVMLLFLAFFRAGEVAAFGPRDVLFAVGSGIVTGLPMVLYSDVVVKFPLTAICFIQYLCPTFALFCGLIRGERFTASQLVSLAFFVISIAIFTAGELRTAKRKGLHNT